MKLERFDCTRDNREYTYGNRNFVCLRTRGYPWVIIEEMGDLYINDVPTREIKNVILNAIKQGEV